MASISLSFYLLKINDISTDSLQAQVFTNLSGKTINELLRNYFRATADDYQNDSANERLFRTISYNEYVHKYNSDVLFNSVAITVKTGNYGIEAELIDSEDTSHKTNIKASQAPVLSFSFSIYYNPMKDLAILVTQSISRNSITNVIKKHLSNMLKQVCPSYKLELKSVTPDKLLKKLLENEDIKNIKIETYKDKFYSIEDDLGSKTNITPAKTYTVFNKPNIEDKGFLYNLFTKHNKVKNIIGLTSDEATIGDISIEFGSKTLRYDAYFNTRVTESITDLFEDPAHVKTSELYPIMNERAFEYLKSTSIIKDIQGCNYENVDTELLYCFEVKEDDTIMERDFNAFIT